MFALCTFVLKSANLIKKKLLIKFVISAERETEVIFMYKEGGRHMMEKERVGGVRREETCHWGWLSSRNPEASANL